MGYLLNTLDHNDREVKVASLNVATTMGRIACIHKQRGDLDDALENFTRSLSILLHSQQKQQGDNDNSSSSTSTSCTTTSSTNDDHYLVAETWNHIGNIHLEKGCTA